jgi:hypothetical protein
MERKDIYILRSVRFALLATSARPVDNTLPVRLTPKRGLFVSLQNFTRRRELPRVLEE